MREVPSDGVRHPSGLVPEIPGNGGQVLDWRDMINWCVVHPNQGEEIDTNSEAMKAPEAYIYWLNSGSALDTGKY